MSYDVFVGWGEESTWGTPVARTQWARCYDDTMLKLNKPQNPSARLGDRDPSEIFYGPKSAEANISVPMYYDGLGKLLKHCMGNVADAGAGPYTHTHSIGNDPYTRASSPLVGLSLELHAALPDSSLGSMLGEGMRVRSFGSNFRITEEARLNVDLLGENCLQAAKTASPTYPSESDLIKPSQILLTIDAGAVDIYGIDWRVNNNLREDKAYIGSEFIAAPNATGKREITATIEKEWVDKTYYDLFAAGTAASILVTATGSGNNAMTFRWANVYIEEASYDINEGEDQAHGLVVRAYDDATYGAFQIVETNDTAST